MSEPRPRIIVNRKPKLLHGTHTIRHPNGNIEIVSLCQCCSVEPKKNV